MPSGIPTPRPDHGGMLRQAMSEEFDKDPQLSHDGFVSKLKELLTAKSLLIATKDGEITDVRQTENHAIQLKAWEHLGVLRGEFPSKQATLNVNVAMERLRDIELPYNELAKLAGISEDDISDADFSPVTEPELDVVEG